MPRIQRRRLPYSPQNRRVPGSLAGASGVTMTVRIFIDTEFVDTADGPRFISAAFLSGRGHELYSELAISDAETLLSQYPNDFVSKNVLPQLGRRPGVPWSDLPARFGDWLVGLGVQVVEVIYDFSGDYLLIEQLIGQLNPAPPVLLVPSHVGYLLGDVDGQIAASATWLAIESTLGLARHHALADAIALRSRFEAVHQPELIVEDSTVEVVATVTAVVSEYELVRAETDDGLLSLSIGEHTPGVAWRTLTPGQRLRCVVRCGPATRVLRAEVLRNAR